MDRKGGMCTYTMTQHDFEIWHPIRVEFKSVFIAMYIFAYQLYGVASWNMQYIFAFALFIFMLSEI